MNKPITQEEIRAVSNVSSTSQVSAVEEICNPWVDTVREEN